MYSVVLFITCGSAQRKPMYVLPGPYLLSEYSARGWTKCETAGSPMSRVYYVFFFFLDSTDGGRKPETSPEKKMEGKWNWTRRRWEMGDGKMDGGKDGKMERWTMKR